MFVSKLAFVKKQKYEKRKYIKTFKTVIETCDGSFSYNFSFPAKGFMFGLGLWFLFKNLLSFQTQISKMSGK